MTGEDPIAADAYDDLADSYAEAVRDNPYNAHMESPARILTGGQHRAETRASGSPGRGHIY